MVAEKKLVTYSEYSKIIDLPANSDRILELIEGEIVEKMPSFIPSEIGLTIGFFVKQYLRQNPISYVTGGDGGYIMGDGNVFVPDVGYISKSRLPQKPDREAPVPPDLAVEVKSPTDSKRQMRRKAERYLELGTQLVWLVFPDEQQVEVYMPDEDVATIGINGILEGGDILPDFKLAVRDIF